MGLAAFAEVDVGIIRLIFILGAVFSGGVVAVAYVVLMFVMPIAHTEPEDRGCPWRRAALRGARA